MKESLAKVKYSFGVSLVLLVAMWLVHVLIYTFYDGSGGLWGVLPRHMEGLKGILFAPMLHGSWDHILYNSLPLFSLTAAIFFFYRDLAWKTFFSIYLLHGALVWIIARESYHIGASGLVYGFASFLFFSGWYRKNSGLLVISLLVIFLYGSMIWGVLPGEEHISWEAHLSGAVSGLFMAWLFRKQGPQRKRFDWEHEPETQENHHKIDDYIEIEDPRLRK